MAKRPERVSGEHPRGVGPGLNAETAKLLEKARRTIHAAELLVQHDEVDAAAGSGILHYVLYRRGSTRGEGAPLP